MLKIEISGSISEIKSEVAGLHGVFAGVEFGAPTSVPADASVAGDEKPADKPVADPKPRGGKGKGTKAGEEAPKTEVAAAAPATTETTASAPATETASAAGGFTADDVANRLSDINKKLGLDAAKGALNHVGANRLSEIKESERAKFIAYVDAQLALVG